MIQKTTKTILIEYLRDKHNENIVYHITSDYYKQNIIENGLVRQFSIRQNQIDSLEALLQTNSFIDLNVNLNFGIMGNQLTMDRIKECFNNINANDYPISASFDYLRIFDYLKEETKGGQYLKEIKTVIAGIEQKTNLNNDLLASIDENLSNMINFINEINRSGFLLCRIDTTGIENIGDGNRFQTTQDINPEKIIEIIELNKLL